MAKIGTLTADLELESAAFVRDLGRAAKAVETNTFKMSQSLKSVSAATQGIEKSFGLVTRAAAAFGVGLSVGAVIAFGKSALAAGANLGELASQLGVSTDALQVLQFAAGQANVKQAELEAGLMRLTKSLGEAAEGSTTAIMAFRAMGVSIVDSNGKMLSTEQVLENIADSYAGAADKAKFMASAVDVGGRSFQRLVPMLEGGRAGLKGWEAAAREAGVVIEKEMIDRLDRASDRIDRFWFELKQKTAIGLGSLLSGLDAGKVEDLQNRLDALLRTPPRLVGGEESRARAIGALQAQIEGFYLAEAALATRRDALSRSSAPLSAATPATTAEQEFAQSIQRRVAAMNEERALVGATAREIALATEVRRAENEAAAKKLMLSEAERQALAAAAAALHDEKQARELKLEVQKQAMEVAMEELRGLHAIAEAEERRKMAIGEASNALQLEVKDTETLIEALQRGTAEYERQRQELELIASLRSRGLADSDIEARRGEMQILLDRRQELEDQKTLYAEIEAFGTRAFDRIGDAVTRMFVEGKGAALDWRNLLLGVISEIAQEFFKLAAINPLKNALFGGSSPTLGGLGGLFQMSPVLSMATAGPGSAAAFVQTGGFFSSPQYFMGFAEGTDSAPPGWAVVGEDGPELVNFRGGETVLPNDFGGGGKTEIYIDARGADAAAIARLEAGLRASNASIEHRAVAAVTRARGRNPGLFGK